MKILMLTPSFHPSVGGVQTHVKRVGEELVKKGHGVAVLTRRIDRSWPEREDVGPIRVVRVPAHLGQIVLLMIAVIAGFGVAGIERRWNRPRSWPAVAAILCALVNVEALRAPLGYTPFSEVPAIYGLFAGDKAAVVVELPLYSPRDWALNAKYMLNSTRHWRPMLNGYSGFRPGSYNETYDAIRGFPDDLSLVALHQRGVTHVVVHEGDFSAAFGRARFDAIADIASLQPLAAEGDIHVYRLR